MNRFTSPSRFVEDSLDDVVSAAEAGLSALDRVKRSARSTTESRQHYAEAKQMLSPELYQPKRASSAPRGTQSYRNVAFEDEGNFEQKRDDSSMERRFESFLRKQKLMEDRIKRLEQQKVADANAALAMQEERDKLMEDRKNDHKTMQGLRSQVSALKARVDTITSSDSAADERSGDGRISGTRYTLQEVNDLVKAAVQSEMARAVPEITGRIQRDSGLGHSTSKSQLSDSKIFNRSAGVEQFTSLEREMIRLSGEFERMKTKQSTLETAYAELKGTTTARELKAEEAHKRAINAHRVEVETFLGSAARRTAESLTTVQAHSQEIAALRAELDGFTDRAGNALAELDMRISFHDQSKDEVYSVLERLEGDTMQLKNQQGDTESTLVRFVEDSLKLARVAGATDSLSRQTAVLQERFETLDVQVQSMSSSLDSQQVPIDMLAKSIDGINEKFEARTDALRQSIDANKSASDESLTSFGEALKKTKGRVKELSESIKGVSQIRQSIEAVLREVDNRAKQDASWTYSFKTALQRVDGRLQAVEQALVNAPGGVSQSELFDAEGAHSAPLHDTGYGSGVGPGAMHAPGHPSYHGHGVGRHSTPLSRPVPLLGTQFDEIRALIADLRQEVKHTTQAECSDLREEFMTHVEERLEAVKSGLFGEVQNAVGAVSADLERSEQNMQDAVAELREKVASCEEVVVTLQGTVDASQQSWQETATEQTSRSAEAIAALAASVSRETERLASIEASLAQATTMANEGWGTAAAELRAMLESVTERIAQQEEHTVESQAHAKTHIGLIDELHTSLGHCQVVLEAHEQQFTALNESVESQQEAWHSVQEDFTAQLQHVNETFSEQCGILQDELHTCKEDLNEHVRFTNDCLGDQQTALEEGLAEARQGQEQQGQVVQSLQADVTKAAGETAEVTYEKL
jgi:chromosome segregation ATPase